jgi:uncharacterized membrane protein
MINRPQIEFSWGWMMTRPLWYDEAFTARVAALPLVNLWDAIRGDVHPPVWYAVEFLFQGGSEFWLRAPSLFFAFSLVGCVLLIYEHARFGNRDLREDHSLLVGVLIVMMPGFCFYAQEARMYAFLAWLVVGAMAILAGVQTGRDLSVMYAILVLLLFTHNLGAIYAALLSLIVIADHGDQLRAARDAWRQGDYRNAVRRAGWIIGPMGAAALTWLPWVLFVMLDQVRDVGNGFWITDVGLGGYLMPLYRLTFGMGTHPFLAFHGAVASIGLLALAAWAIWRGRRRTYPLAVLAFAPAVILAILSEVWRPVYLERFLLPSMPFLLILAFWGLSEIRQRLRYPILAILIPLALISVATMRKGSEHYPTLVADIAENYETGTVIYHANLASYVLLSYYLPEDTYTHVAWPDAGNLEQALSLRTQAALGIQRQHAADLPAERLLVVWVENPMVTQAEVNELHAALETGTSRLLSQWKQSELSIWRLWEVNR